MKFSTQTKTNMLSSNITKAIRRPISKMAAVANLKNKVNAINWAIIDQF
jgi:hypothetical protein